MLEVRDLGKLGPGEELSIQNPDTMTMKRRQEEKCFQVSHPASAPVTSVKWRDTDLLTPSFLCTEWQEKETNVAFVVRLLYGQSYCN